MSRHNEGRERIHSDRKSNFERRNILLYDVTTEFLQVVAGDIEKLLLENYEHIAFAYLKIPDGIKLSLGINLDPSSQGIVVSYDLSFDLEPKPEAPEKHKVKFKHTINTSQTTLMDAIDRLTPKKGSGIDSVTISSGEHSVTLDAQ